MDDKVELLLSGSKIIFEHSFKYLGIIISDDLKINLHLDSKLFSFENRLKTLLKAGFYKNKSGVEYRTMLINTYAKPPLLLYGLDIYDITNNQLMELSKSLSNKLKVMYDLSTRLKIKEIFYAHRIKQIKLQLFCRLYSNSYTNELLRSLFIEKSYHDVSKSLISRVENILNTKADNLSDLFRYSSNEIGNLKFGYRQMVKSNEISHIKW